MAKIPEISIDDFILLIKRADTLDVIVYDDTEGNGIAEINGIAYRVGATSSKTLFLELIDQSRLSKPDKEVLDQIF